MLIEVSHVMELWNNYYDSKHDEWRIGIIIEVCESLKGISMLYIHLKRLDVNDHVMTKFDKDFIKYTIQALN